MVISKRKISLKRDQLNHIYRVVTETFKNAKFTHVQEETSNPFIEFSIDMLEDEPFRLTAPDFLERIGLDPADWKVFLQAM